MKRLVTIREYVGPHIEYQCPLCRVSVHTIPKHQVHNYRPWDEVNSRRLQRHLETCEEYDA